MRLPDDIKKLIRNLAKIEKKEIAFERANKDAEPSQKGLKEFLAIKQKGDDVRDALLDHPFFDDLFDANEGEPDYAEDLDKLGTLLLRSYAADRIVKEIDGKKPDENLFYAGANMLEHAVMLKEDNEDDEEDDDNSEDEYLFPHDLDFDAMSDMAEQFSDSIKKADASDPIVADMAESAEFFLKEKGFDIKTLEGCQAAAAWLDQAKPEDAYYSEGPIVNALEWHIAEARLDAMSKIVKDRIRKLSGQ